MTDKKAMESKGLFQSVSALASTFIAIAHTRLEILSADIEEDRERMISLIKLAIVALFSLITSIVLVTITIVVAFWDSYRIIVLCSLASIFAVIGVVSCLVAMRRLKAKPKTFITTLQELIKDRQQLDVS